MLFSKQFIALCVSFPLLAFGAPTPNGVDAVERREPAAPVKTWPYYGYPAKRDAGDTPEPYYGYPGKEKREPLPPSTWPYYGYPAKTVTSTQKRSADAAPAPEDAPVPVYGYPAGQ